MSADRILTPGRNCWRIEQAERAAFLVEGEQYFAAAHDAITRARHRLFILGWDIDSNLRLLRDGGDDGGPLGPFLNRAVSSRPDLQAYILIWDFAMIYAMEREWLPVYRLGWKTHRRLHFRLDDQHPVGGSQHQKVVVVDDAVAFVGGMDLGKWRWDSVHHAPGDLRRRDASGNRYVPYHDVQMAVSGPAAAALGELARERWRRATGETLPAVEPVGDPWPQAVTPDLAGVEVAIARTEPRYDGRPEVREVERLYLDTIAAAKRYLYIENQYLTSKVIGDALAVSLNREEGPELIIVVPQRTGGWLERNTMDVLRRHLLHQIRAADRHGRLRVVYPHIPDLEPETLSVHSKLMIADDRLVRVGSSNLSNRSMGLDSECDLCLEGEAVTPAARKLLGRLLGEHLDVSPAEVLATFEETGSLRAVLDRYADHGRTLRALDENSIRVDPDIEMLVSNSRLVDPERPVDPEQLAERVVPQEQRPPARRGVAFVVGTLVLLFALAAAWRWTPLRDWLDIGLVAGWAREVRDSNLAPLIVIGTYVIGGLLVVPVTFLVVVTVVTFGAAEGFAYSLAGSLASAAVVFALGHYIGRDTVRHVAGARLNKLSRRLARRGLLAIVTVRVLPVAPFTVVNLVAGVSHIRFSNFMLGTLIGMTPGLLGLSLFMDRLIAAIRQPGMSNFVFMALVVLLLVAAGFAVRRWLKRGRPRQPAKREA